jgi:hypothetical protein
VRGTFTTLKYNSRLDFKRRQLAEMAVTHNDFTNVGYEWMWRRMAGQTEDSLDNAVIAVGNGNGIFTAGQTELLGDQVSRMALDDGSPIVTGAKLTLSATFGERDGAFDWFERGVITPSGVLIDRSVGDQGRKVLGAVWVVIAELELATS